MKKKTIITLCAALALVLVAGAVIVACLTGGAPEVSDTTGNTEQALDTTGDTGEGQTENTAEPTENSGPVSEMGVSDREDFDEGTTPTENTTTPVEIDSTKPTETEPTEPSQPQTSVDTSDPANVTYAQYIAMAPEDQEAFVESFPTLKDFINWRNAALEKEEERDTEILDGSGEIDLSKP